MRFQRILSGSLILLLALALGAVASAQERKQEAVTTAVTGKIVSVDTAGKMLTVSEDEGDTVVFVVEPDTTIMSGDKEVALDGLHPGEWVVVNADQRGTGQVATYVEVVDDPTSD